MDMDGMHSKFAAAKKSAGLTAVQFRVQMWQCQGTLQIWRHLPYKAFLNRIISDLTDVKMIISYNNSSVEHDHEWTKQEYICITTFSISWTGCQWRPRFPASLASLSSQMETVQTPPNLCRRKALQCRLRHFKLLGSDLLGLSPDHLNWDWNQVLLMMLVVIQDYPSFD